MVRNYTEAVTMLSEETGISPEEIIDNEYIIENEDGLGYITCDGSSEVEHEYSTIINGSVIYIHSSDDTDLLDWLDEQDVNQFTVMSSDSVQDMVWLSDCPYGIQSKDIAPVIS